MEPKSGAKHWGSVVIISLASAAKGNGQHRFLDSQKRPDATLPGFEVFETLWQNSASTSRKVGL